MPSFRDTMKNLAAVIFSALFLLASNCLAQTAPVLNTRQSGGASLNGVWGIKIYPNKLLDISPREFGRCTADPDLPLVYCGAGDGAFRALRKHDGQTVWTLQTSGAVRAAPGVSPDGVFLASADGCVHRLDRKTGKALWKKPYCIGIPVWGTPVVTPEAIYFSALGNQVYAVDIDTGKFRFKVTRDKPRDMSSEGISAPTVSGDVLYSAFSDGVLVASDRFNGRELWVQDLAQDSNGPTDADATPVVFDDIVYSAAFSAGPIAMRATDGIILWKGERFGCDKPVIYKDLLIIGDADGFLTAFDRKTGELKWSTRLDTSAVWNPVLVSGLLLAGGDRGLWLVNPDDGSVLLLKKLPFGQTAEPAVDGRDIYFTAPGGTINKASLFR